MGDSTPNPDADRGTPPGMPRWVKVAALVIGLLILLLVVLQLTGIAGEHGPGRHFSGSMSPAIEPPAVPRPPATLVGG